MNELDKEMSFFIYLLEHYAAYKKMSAKQVLNQWDSLGLTSLIYNMYERYHSEALQNAFMDIDALVVSLR
jgi:hypothetical protein